MISETVNSTPISSPDYHDHGHDDNSTGCVEKNLTRSTKKRKHHDHSPAKIQSESGQHINGKSIKVKKKYDETIVDGFVFTAFKTWEDLQDELNERIAINSCNVRSNHYERNTEVKKSQPQDSPSPSSSTSIDERRTTEISLDGSSSCVGKKSGHKNRDEKYSEDETALKDALKAKEEAERRLQLLQKKLEDQEKNGQNVNAEKSSNDSNDFNKTGNRQYDIFQDRDLKSDHSTDPATSLFFSNTYPPFSGKPDPDRIKLNNQVLLGSSREYMNPKTLGGHPFGQEPPRLQTPAHAVRFAPDHLGAYQPQNIYPLVLPRQTAVPGLHKQSPYLFAGQQAFQHPLPPQPPPPLPPSSSISSMSMSTMQSPYTYPYVINETTISRQTSIIPPPHAGLSPHLAIDQMANRFNNHTSISQSMSPYNQTHTPQPGMISPTERSFLEYARSYVGAGQTGPSRPAAMVGPFGPHLRSHMPEDPFDPLRWSRVAPDHHRGVNPYSHMLPGISDRYGPSQCFPGARPPLFPVGAFPPPF